MDWREALIAYHERTIDQLQQGIADMRAGRFEMRSFEGGSWRVINDEVIARDEATIATLQRIVDDAKAKLNG